ncbi:MAG: hypothetical protein DMF90_21950 [Acidobacteria bacterium]|nr:MAG: hypothetical protein DMF90_21950 [Acidobacteriota bacterium]
MNYVTVHESAGKRNVDIVTASDRLLTRARLRRPRQPEVRRRSRVVRSRRTGAPDEYPREWPQRPAGRDEEPHHHRTDPQRSPVGPLCRQRLRESPFVVPDAVGPSFAARVPWIPLHGVGRCGQLPQHQRGPVFGHHEDVTALALADLPGFAALLGVPQETYRTWDAGRRPVAQARALAGHPDDQELLPLPVLAAMLRVHVRTLHLAARLGRLTVVYDTRTTFRRLRPRATRAAALIFRQLHYRKHGRRGQVALPLSWAMIPTDYDRQIRAARERLGLSQAQFATAIGAARKAVVYQWESRKRCPSPVFWPRFERLIASIG